MWRLMMGVGLMLGSWSLQAMTLEVVDDKIFATGGVGGDDFQNFKTAFENPKITTVVLVNSPGGDLWTGMTIGRMIADKGYNTVAVGFCHSACSIMFLGGTERRFADSLRPAFNVIGIHGPSDGSKTGLLAGQAPQMFAFYKQRMGDKFNSTVMQKALYEMEDASGLLQMQEVTRNPRAQTFFCPSRFTPRKDCVFYKEHTGLSLGVLTHNELASISLPKRMQQHPAVLGKELGSELLPALADLSPMLEVISKSKCTGEPCASNAIRYKALKENKAIATRITTAQSNLPGIGFISNRDTAIDALARAVYNCNHFRSAPVGLCEIRFVNDFDVQGLYVQSELEHKEALAKLAVPKDKFYNNEEFGGGFTRAEGLKVQRLEAMTPKEIEGIRTIGTQDLVKAMLSDKPPVIIDVWGAVNDGLPTAHLLVNGSFVRDTPALDEAYNKRFVSLLSLFAPDKSQPVVFYCAHRECWQSVNASRRAKLAGYSNVWWYRGGWQAWKEAQLPTALVTVRAVVHVD